MQTPILISLLALLAAPPLISAGLILADMLPRGARGQLEGRCSGYDGEFAHLFGLVDLEGKKRSCEGKGERMGTDQKDRTL